MPSDLICGFGTTNRGTLLIFDVNWSKVKVTVSYYLTRVVKGTALSTIQIIIGRLPPGVESPKRPITLSKCKVELCNLFETGQCLIINTCVKFHSIPPSSL